MEVRHDWAAVEGHRYRAYCELVLRPCRTAATDPAYPELQARCRDAAGRWQEAYRARWVSTAQPAPFSEPDSPWGVFVPPAAAGLQVAVGY